MMAERKINQIFSMYMFYKLETKWWYDTMSDPEDKLNHDSYGHFLVIFYNN